MSTEEEALAQLEQETKEGAKEEQLGKPSDHMRQAVLEDKGF